MIRSLPAFCVALLVMMCGFAVLDTPARAQSGAQTGVSAAQVQRIEDRLYRMERDVEGLVRMSGGSSGAGLEGDAAARISVRLSALENEIANLTGMLEEMRHQLNVEQQTAQKAREDFEFRLQALETRAAAAPAPSAGAAIGGSAQLPPDDLFGQGGVSGGASGGMQADSNGPTTGTVPATGGAQRPGDLTDAPLAVPQMEPKALYQTSMQQLAERKYASAEAGFSAFVERFPDHLLAGNAQYWLGESYYARNNYKEAAAAFLAGVRKYPDSTKAPGAMLKLGMSLNQLGHQAQACATLSELKTRHPDMSAKIKARVAREEEAMSCQQ